VVSTQTWSGVHADVPQGVDPASVTWSPSAACPPSWAIPPSAGHATLLMASSQRCVDVSHVQTGLPQLSDDAQAVAPAVHAAPATGEVTHPVSTVVLLPPQAMTVARIVA
jgi:hypothetical protein